jgi:hypothetical protein
MTTKPKSEIRSQKSEIEKPRSKQNRRRTEDEDDDPPSLKSSYGEAGEDDSD